MLQEERGEQNTHWLVPLSEVLPIVKLKGVLGLSFQGSSSWVTVHQSSPGPKSIAPSLEHSVPAHFLPKDPLPPALSQVPGCPQLGLLCCWPGYPEAVSRG